MEYTVIDPKTWERREYYEHYMTAVPCTYSMTVKLDITTLRHVKLYPAMLCLLTETVNELPQFRMDLRPDGRLVRYDRMHPSYTIFHRDSETFSSIWTEFYGDRQEFFRQYEKDVQRYGREAGFSPKPGMPDNCFNVSMIPWAAFESFQLNTPGFDYLLPIFTMGKFIEGGGLRMLPLAVQVHHAVCDGWHVGQFIESLQEKLYRWEVLLC